MDNINKKKVMVLVIIIILIALILIVNIPTNCDSDENCFNSATLACSKAKVITYNNDTKYKYEILGSKGDNCIIEVQLLDLPDYNSYDVQQSLEGKSMTCSLLFSTLQDKTIKEIENLNNYCTGQLKETTLQITVDKMYEIIVQNIGPIVAELNKTSSQY